MLRTGSGSRQKDKVLYSAQSLVLPVVHGCTVENFKF